MLPSDRDDRRPCAHQGATATSCAICDREAENNKRIAALLMQDAKPRDRNPPENLPPMSDAERRAKMREMEESIREALAGKDGAA